jgi:hypothetical protein
LFLFFLSEHHAFLRQGDFLTSAVVSYQLNWSEGMEHSSADHPSGQGL